MHGYARVNLLANERIILSLMYLFFTFYQVFLIVKRFHFMTNMSGEIKTGEINVYKIVRTRSDRISLRHINLSRQVSQNLFYETSLNCLRQKHRSSQRTRVGFFFILCEKEKSNHYFLTSNVSCDFVIFFFCMQCCIINTDVPTVFDSSREERETD